ncbi:hypothetical protein [Nocardia grenadensis]|uniref:hypothetical protein n=1 Tax=Nocardia grenadensis TaxID=931537 RepID=UPI0007A4DB69|nr:hypothetical protein [Nocardia grenadensis]
MAAVRELTGGVGVDRVIEAVGVDPQRPHSGPAAGDLPVDAETFESERTRAAPRAIPVTVNGWSATRRAWDCAGR